MKENAGGAGCGKKEGDPNSWQGGVAIDLGFVGTSELWGYRLEARSNGCWGGRTIDRYGPYQSSVEAYRQRELLSPDKNTVGREVREANALRRT